MNKQLKQKKLSLLHMLKKCAIFIFLATSYSVLLAHNFIPHQHETKHATHHHHHHSHGHDDHHESDEKSSFHYFQHIAESGIEYTFAPHFKYEVRKQLCETSFIPCAITAFGYFEKPPLLTQLSPPQYFSIPKIPRYFFPLKAPPAFTA
jgi:hypothetical protein